MPAMSWTALAFTMVLAAGFPPIDEPGEQRQLASASDRGVRVDEGALYPLLRNVMQWNQPLRTAGTRVPDYAAIEAEPAKQRGELFTIEGTFVESEPRHLSLSRSGVWGKKLTKWAIQVSDQPEPRVIIVLFADPNDSLPTPADGAKVRTVGRFFKVWRPYIRENQRVDWLVFVARDAKVVQGGASAGGGAGAEELFGLVLVVVVAVFGYVLWRARRARAAGPGSGTGFSLFSSKPIAPKRLSHRSEDEDAEADEHADAGPPLPEQSDQALAELSRRHSEDDPGPAITDDNPASRPGD
jgi:hypothetical protein